MHHFQICFAFLDHPWSSATLVFRVALPFHHYFCSALQNWGWREVAEWRRSTVVVRWSGGGGRRVTLDCGAIFLGVSGSGFGLWEWYDRSLVLAPRMLSSPVIFWGGDLGFKLVVGRLIEDCESRWFWNWLQNINLNHYDLILNHYDLRLNHYDLK